MLRKFATLTVVAVGTAMLATTTTAQYKPLDGDPKAINFGIISTESTQNLKQAWMPLIKDMQTSLGMPVKPFFAPDYAGVIEAMRFGKVRGLVWQQVGDGSGRPCRWRSFRSGDKGQREAGLLFPCPGSQGQQEH